jgi:hypothetical protein
MSESSSRFAQGHQNAIIGRAAPLRKTRLRRLRDAWEDECCGEDALPPRARNECEGGKTTPRH